MLGKTYPAVLAFYFLSPFSAFHSSHGPKSIPVTGEAMLHSEVPPALTSVVVGTPGSPSSSATSTDSTSSLGQTLSSSVTKAHQTDGWQGDTDLTEHPQELSSLLSASAHVFTGNVVSLKDACFVPGVGFASLIFIFFP